MDKRDISRGPARSAAIMIQLITRVSAGTLESRELNAQKGTNNALTSVTALAIVTMSCRDA